MSLKTFVAKIWARNKAKSMKREMDNAISLQRVTFQNLISKAKNTAFGKAHGFEDIKNFKDFQERVPIRNYEGAKDWFDRIYNGEADVSWPGKPLYLAKTSGTTSGAKHIPISKESIINQINAARDALLLYVAETGKASFLDGKMMFLSGSPEIDENAYGLKTGRLSGIVNHFVPAYLTSNRVPKYATNIIEDWEEKVSTIVKEIKDQDLRLISGIPPWVQMLFEELEVQTGKKPLEVWPKLELFVQGGVNFAPYAPIFEQYFEGKLGMVEVFPASEGFFAYQNSQKDDGLMILPNNGIFFEFIPMEEYGSENPRRLTLAEVELDKQYALIVSTNAGLWAYDIGDTVKFTSIKPWKLRVSGRVKHFISAFGEHVIAEEVNDAILEASAATGAKVQEFTVAPFIVEEKGQSAHEWFIEFVNAPTDLDAFTHKLDTYLQGRNAYYADLREGNILRQAIVNKVELNASRSYMKAEGKLGGQNKFPRLSNDRKIAEFLKDYIQA
ncbi:MAG: GH3 auxin-responsive promoter family protein [Bacteroidia bacterium]|nr:GH3 auxin-responsive promoter family protein [Bacteroidia bacterium]